MNRKETNIKLKNRFAINLKKYRKENEMTQKKLSETSNVDLQALYRYENGTSEASAINAYKIATAMNITIEKLFEDEEKNNTKKNNLFVTTSRTDEPKCLNCGKPLGEHVLCCSLNSVQCQSIPLCASCLIKGASLLEDTYENEKSDKETPEDTK